MTAGNVDPTAFALLRELPAEAARGLIAASRPQTWPAGRLVFQRGDAGTFMAFIRRGRVQMLLTSAQGKEILVRQVGPGDVLGEIALIDGGERSADARAAEDTEVLILTRPAFHEAAEHIPGLYAALARYLCAALRATNYQMESIALYDLQARLARFFLLAAGSSPDRAPGKVRVNIDISQSEISAILGASRPKVNQALQALQADGAVARDGTGYLCDPGLLADIADGGRGY